MDVKQAIILLYGLGCSGKSFSLATLFKLRDIRPNQRVVFLTTEKNALDGLQRGLKHYNIKLEENQLFYAVIKPSAKKKAFGQEIKALEKFAGSTVTQAQQTNRDDNANKDKYTYFLEVVKGLHKFVGIDYVSGKELELGNIAELAEEDILIIDGLSPIIHGMWQLCQGDRKVNQIGDYQIVQKQINDFTYELVNSVYCTLIVLAHADRIFDDIEKKELIRVALDAGVALSGKYIGKYTDVIYTYRQGTNYYWCGEKMGVETAPRNFPAKDRLTPDFSLYNFFKEDGMT